MRIGRRACAVLAFAFAMLAGASSRAHPYHTSTAQIDVRGERLEIALKAEPEDLEQALTRLAGRRVHLDRDTDVDRWALEYLRTHFIVRHETAGPRPLTWVGKDVSIAEAWLFFECTVPGGARAHVLLDTMFFDIAPTQTNLVLVNDGERSHSLTFRLGARSQALVR